MPLLVVQELHQVELFACFAHVCILVNLAFIFMCSLRVVLSFMWFVYSVAVTLWCDPECLL